MSLKSIVEKDLARSAKLVAVTKAAETASKVAVAAQQNLTAQQPTTLSSIVRVTIRVSSTNSSKCSWQCPFYMQDLIDHCTAFSKSLGTRSYNSTEMSRPQRLQDCLDMFGHDSVATDATDAVTTKPAATKSDILPDFDKLFDAENAESSTASELTAIHHQEPKNVGGETDKSNSKPTPATGTMSDMLDMPVEDIDLGVDNEQLSDAALGLDAEDFDKPLDGNDPVAKDSSWKHYRDEEPKPYAYVSVYGRVILQHDHSKSVSKTERLVFKKVRAFQCSDSVRELLSIAPGLGYGKVVGSNETVEIHRWRKTKTYVKTYGGK